MTVHNDFLIKDILWYHIGGKVKYVLDVSSKDDLIQAAAFIKTHNIQKVFVAATGANLLFTDEYFDGVVIHILSPEEFDVCVSPDYQVEVFSGIILDYIIQFGFQNNLTGLSWAGGLPGSIGAGIRGNVGAFGGEIKDVFVSAEVLDMSSPGLQFETYTKERMQFEYRGSTIKHKKNLVIGQVTLQMQRATDEDLLNAKEEYDSHIQYRQENHPMDFFNTGSVFKNIDEKDNIEKVIAVLPDLKETIETKWHGKVSAGFLITHLGLKGFKKGGAEVSEQHANFINNVDNATFADVMEIIETIQNKCQETFGFRLEPEVEIVQ
jgi:UDP-N-acetylmuramate dehydrogenase